MKRLSKRHIKADAKELAFALQALIRFMEREPGLQYEVGAIVEFENAQKAINNYLDEQGRQKASIKSVFKKKADSYTDGNAWVRKFLDESELASDIRVTQILASNASEEEKMKYIASRATELLQEGGYEDYRIQNVSGDDIKIDHEQIYKLVVQDSKLRESSKKSKAEWAYKKGTSNKTKCQKCGKVLDLNFYSKLDTLCDSCYSDSLQTQEKKAMPEDKWQSQKEVVPIGLGERGWQAYEPYKKSDADPKHKSILRNTELKEAVDKLMVNKDPQYLEEVKKKITDFVSQTKVKDKDKQLMIQKVQGMNNPFDLMKYYYYAISKFEIESTETEVESGFFDGPTDLGKRPKGDFPSVQWMPKGQEDLDVRDDDYLTNRASKGQDGQVDESEAKWQVEIHDGRAIQYFSREEDAKSYYQRAKKEDKDPWTPARFTKEENNHVIPKCDRKAEAQPIKLTAEDTANGNDTPPQLTNKMLTDMIPMLIEGGEPTNHNCGNCNMRIVTGDGDQAGCTLLKGLISLRRGTCNYMAPGEAATEEDKVEMSLTNETAGYVELPNDELEVNCASCMYYDAEKEYCKTWMGTIKPEGCCMAWDRTDVTVPEMEKKASGIGRYRETYHGWIIKQRWDGKYMALYSHSESKPEIFGPTLSSVKQQIDTDSKQKVEATVVQWLQKQSSDPISDENSEQIAAKYGPEYNSALRHFNDAVKNGHDSEKALEYAIVEMEKVQTPVNSNILREVAETYSAR